MKDEYQIAKEAREQLKKLLTVVNKSSFSIDVEKVANIIDTTDLGIAQGMLRLIVCQGRLLGKTL